MGAPAGGRATPGLAARAPWDDAAVERSFCFVLLKPDAVLRRSVAAILRWLEEHGFDLLAWRCGRLSRGGYDRLYARGFRWDLDLWAHNARAYGFGPVVGLALWRTDATDPGAQAWLNERKGSALPERVRPGTLRAMLDVRTRVFNGLHVAQRVEDAIGEASAWLGARVEREVRRRLDAGAAGGQERSYAETVSARVDAHGYLRDRELDGLASLARIKVRLLDTVLGALELPAGPRGHLESLAAVHLDCAEKLGTVPVWSPEHARAGAAANAAEERRIEELATPLRDFPELVELLDVMRALGCGREAHPHLQATLEFFWHGVESWSVFVSDLEAYAVESSLIYPTPDSPRA